MPCIIVQPPGAAFQPSGMILSAAFTPTLVNNYTTIPNWTADAAYPGSTISSDGLVAQGTKAGATIAASCLVANSYFLSAYSCTLRLLVNGATAVTGSATSIPASGTGTATASITYDIAAGDVLTVQVSITNNQLAVQPTSSWARIT